MPRRILLSVGLVIATAAAVTAEDWSAARFDRELAPLLIARCLDCHSGPKPKGGLDLTTRRSALRGGETGPGVSPGNLDESEVWGRVDAGEMPPKQPLAKSERSLIRDWIEAGATWGSGPIDRFSRTTKERAGYDWWSFQPLRRPKLPSGDATHPIDRFVRAKLNENGLRPSQRASPRALGRRLHFDLLGLPPTVEDVQAFEAAMREDSQTAIRKYIDRLLASRHFGERWGRHWLDIVRFGESQGFERDKLRMNSWQYRDWVIDAINRDMPYDEFVRQQLAGDVLYPEDAAAITATGFLVAGPWDEVGQSQRSSAMKAIVRQDEIEDYVGTIGQTFLGLTTNCARCHDHKFDPIRQKEYYQLASAVGGVRHGERFVVSQQDKQRSRAIDREILTLEDRMAEIDSTARNRLHAKSGGKGPLPKRVRPVARWTFATDLKDQIGSAHAIQHPKAKLAKGRLLLDSGAGYAATHPVKLDLHEKTLEAWVRLDDLNQRGGAALSIQTTDQRVFDAIVYGEIEARRWMSGSDFFRRSRSLKAAPSESLAQSEFVQMAISYAADGAIHVYRNGKPYGESYKSSGPVRFLAGQWTVLFGLRTGGSAPDRQLRGQLELAQLYDRALTEEEVNASLLCEQASIEEPAILAALSEQERSQQGKLATAIGALKKERRQRRPHPVYAVKPGKVEKSFVLHRGNPATRGEEVVPGGVAAIAGSDSTFDLAADSGDSDRRKKLAAWITAKKNPLFARVIVNRIWHYHFGQGLVTTPNDFGFNGARPSHPDLLAWLAVELIDAGWRLKHIHRLIVSSETYLQASRHRQEVDSFDYKPELERLHGKSLVSDERPDVFFGQVGLLRKSDWKYRQRGESGLWISELFPHLATVADELTVIRSMFAETSNHTPATFQQNTGFRLNGFPTAGAWLSFGMGCETDELPAYVVVPDTRGVPAGGSINWTNGFLPAQFQGVSVSSSGTPIKDLFPARKLDQRVEVASRELLRTLNKKHLEERGQSDSLTARIRSYALSERMQKVVPEVANLGSESKSTQQMYGIGVEPTAEFARSCLLARRLLERGVRFVQLFAGGAFGQPRINWDGHEDMVKNHGREAARVDKPVAALLRDLRQRGMLDDTLVLFTSEFGRTPFTQSAADIVGTGRDHNEKGFSVWLAGGGLKHGVAYGATDDVGWKAVEDRVPWHDFHATVLHLLGLDHERLTFYHNGIERRLTNVHGELIKGILS